MRFLLIFHFDFHLFIGAVAVSLRVSARFGEKYLEIESFGINRQYGAREIHGSSTPSYAHKY
jgi:hypothetical protein